MAEWWRKLKALLRRDALDAELQEEVQSHLDMRAADLGNAQAALWQDLRYGLRMLLRTPGFTTVAVLSLANASRRGHRWSFRQNSITRIS